MPRSYRAAALATTVIGADLACAATTCLAPAMALVTCPDCGTQVSDQAQACPRCARPLQAAPAAPQGQGWPAQVTPPPKQGVPTGLIVALVLVPALIAIVGVMAVLGIYGVRKYIANAKVAEARNAVGQMARDAIVAYEGDGARRICPSATSAVPADRTRVSGKKYQSTTAEWNADAASNAGFACIKFQMPYPQYFQYEYESTATGFVARAHGDLNGDGVFSTFEVRGQLVGDRLVMSPTVLEISPEE